MKIMKQETKICQNCKQKFTIDPDDFGFYEKMKVPAPTWCPDCRLQRRLTFRNERTFYKRPCDLCDVSTISRYDPSKRELSYCGECWWGDKWDPASYGQEYDFSRPFFEQFSELMKKVPHQNLSVSYKTLTNSDYTNMNHYLKNCYYIFNSDYDERCLYGEEIEHSADCVDITMAESTQLAYESVHCKHCFLLIGKNNKECYDFSQFGENTEKVYESLVCGNGINNVIGGIVTLEGRDIRYSIDCRDSNRFGCVGIRDKRHYIFNKE